LVGREGLALSFGLEFWSDTENFAQTHVQSKCRSE
jgi:hypothetical protein